MKTVLCAAVVAFSAITVPAWSQAFPAKPVRLIVPFPPGGGFDAIGRPFAEKLSGVLGQPVIVDNRAGASGNIGATAAARAPADGYTLLLGNDFLALNVVLSADPGYNALTDIVPVSFVGTVPTVIAINPALPARDLKQLMAHSKIKALNFGTSAPGSVGHLLGEQMNLSGVMKMVHVPYKGSGPAVADTIGGTIDAVITTLPSVAAQIRGGKLRGIGVFSARRASSMPDLPTVAESGGPDEVADVWYGLFSRTGTPPAVLQRLNQASVEALAQPELIEALRKAGFEPGSSTPAMLGARLKGDVERWTRVAKAVDIRKE